MNERLPSPDWLDVNEIVVTQPEAKPCPFCGYQPTIQPWHGGGPMKRLVHCANENCGVAPGVAGSRRDTALLRWNSRA